MVGSPAERARLDPERPAERRPLRVALFGSPGFAVPSLERLQVEHELLLVVTQPDKPAGRGLATRSPAAAAWAREHGFALAQPARLARDEAFLERLAALELDVAVTAAYGKILPERLLAIPRHGFLNVHASLLPKYRGAAPVQWALIEGESETGVSIMQTEAGLDTGPVRHVLRTLIGPEEDAAALTGRLAVLGAEALSQALELLARGTLPCEPQDHSAATLAPRLTRDDGRIRWRDPSSAVSARHRGVTPWPGSWFLRTATVSEEAGPQGSISRVEAAAETVKVHALRELPGSSPAGLEPGTVTEVAQRGVSVATGDGAVLLETLQSPGRPKLGASEWARGARLVAGERCG